MPPSTSIQTSAIQIRILHLITLCTLDLQSIQKFQPQNSDNLILFHSTIFVFLATSHITKHTYSNFTNPNTHSSFDNIMHIRFVAIPKIYKTHNMLNIEDRRILCQGKYMCCIKCNWLLIMLLDGQKMVLNLSSHKICFVHFVANETFIPIQKCLLTRDLFLLFSLFTSFVLISNGRLLFSRNFK